MIETQISIERPSGEICVDVSSDNPGMGYAAESKSGYLKDEAIPLTAKEQEDAEEQLLAKALSLAKRDIDFEVDAYTPTAREQDAAADRYFAGRGRL